jgi:preprotein translocase subunit YajC
MTNMQTILLSAGADPGTMQLYMIVLMVVVFYFFMIMPQMKKNKAQKKFREEIAKGDKIITSGGIHGKITELKETTIVIEVEDGSKIRIEKSAINMESTQALKSETK